MTQTTSTSVTELVNTEAINRLVIAYPSDDDNVVPFFRYQSLIGSASAVASFPRWVKDAHEDLATEGTAMTPQELETTSVEITTARAGLAREPTNTVLDDTVLGRNEFLNRIAQDVAILRGMARAEDGAAQFANASGSASDSGNAIEISDLVYAMGYQRRQKARGVQVIHLHDFQLQQLQQAQAAATATPWATFYQPAADSTQFGGYFMNAEVWSSSLNPTANAGADRVGCIWARGDILAQEMFCAFGYAVSRMPTTKARDEVLEDSYVTATTWRDGVGAIATNFATKLVFRNS